MMFRDIPGCEGYQVSDIGEVFSLKSNKLLSCKIDRYGYKCYTLFLNGKAKYFTAHRLVALTFIENPHNLPCINHINENKLDNRAENLEWCTVKQNDNHGTRNERMAHTKETKPVEQIFSDGSIRKFRGVKDASRKTGINRSQISRVCRGLSKTAGKCEWRYS